MDMKVSILKSDFINAFILLHAPIAIGEGGRGGGGGRKLFLELLC